MLSKNISLQYGRSTIQKKIYMTKDFANFKAEII